MSLSAIIIGGGASGTLLAIRLLRSSVEVDVTLIERSATLGRGLAYATEDDKHVLNVVPEKMSAFADDLDNFRRWLLANSVIEETDAFAFVPRRHFGTYLEATLQAVARRSGRLRIVRDSVVSLRPGAESISAVLAGGSVVTGDIAVLATGHDTSPARLAAPDRGDLPILILGTGLSMADAWLSLAGAGRRVLAMSRRGLLPLSHGVSAPFPVELNDLPFGGSVTQVLRWLRRLARETEADTGDWRGAVDAIRPHAQRLWASWSIESRHRFLRHLKPWWDIHRHRLPAQVYEQLRGSIGAGALHIIAAKSLAVEGAAGSQTVRFRRRGSTTIETVTVSMIVDCRGLIRDWHDRAGSLVSRLIADRQARSGPLALGIDVTQDNEIVAADGQVQPNLFAIGPLTRDKWLEIEAVPEIRAQCDRLASYLESAMAGADPGRHLGSDHRPLSDEFFRTAPV